MSSNTLEPAKKWDILSSGLDAQWLKILLSHLNVSPNQSLLNHGITKHRNPQVISLIGNYWKKERKLHVDMEKIQPLSRLEKERGKFERHDPVTNVTCIVYFQQNRLNNPTCKLWSTDGLSGFSLLISKSIWTKPWMERARKMKNPERWLYLTDFDSIKYAVY